LNECACENENIEMQTIYIINKDNYSTVEEARVDNAVTTFEINDQHLSSMGFRDSMEDVARTVRATSMCLMNDECTLEAYMVHPETGKYETCDAMLHWPED
jgi:hypothetical protein